LKCSVHKGAKAAAVEVESPESSMKFLPSFTSQSVVQEVPTPESLVDSMVAETLVDPQEWKAPEVEPVISELVIHLAPGLLLLAVAAVVDQDLVQAVVPAED
jgi:hypothetical protein